MCLLVFLDKSSSIYATGDFYVSQPFNIPNKIVDSFLNIL